MQNFPLFRSLLASARTAEALEQLSAWAQHQSPVWRQATLLLQASWANNEQQALRGLIAYPEAEQVRNRITAGALGLMEEIESGASAPKAVLEGLQKEFLSEPVAATLAGGNVTNISGSQIHVQGSQNVVIGSGNTINKKTYVGLGKRQFWGIALVLLLVLVGGYFAFDLLRERQELTYVSLQEIRNELKMRSELDTTVNIRVEKNQSTLDRWINDGMNALQKKQYPAAVANLEKAAQEVPLATVHQNLAYAYQQIGEDSKSQKNLDEAIKINPNLKKLSSGQVNFNLTGAWESAEWEWGAMTLTQTGNKIAGTYVHDRGQMDCTIKSDRIEFKWWELVDPGKPYSSAEKLQRGDGYFVVSADGKTISGVWRYDGDTAWKDKWSAVKK